MFRRFVPLFSLRRITATRGNRVLWNTTVPTYITHLEPYCCFEIQAAVTSEQPTQTHDTLYCTIPFGGLAHTTNNFRALLVSIPSSSSCSRQAKILISGLRSTYKAEYNIVFIHCSNPVLPQVVSVVQPTMEKLLSQPRWNLDILMKTVVKCIQKIDVVIVSIRDQCHERVIPLAYNARCQIIYLSLFID